jgi:hypothetical protein
VRHSLKAIGRIVTGIHVRVEGAGKLPVGLLDLFSGGFRRDSQDVVVAAQVFISSLL